MPRSQTQEKMPVASKPPYDPSRHLLNPGDTLENARKPPGRSRGGGGSRDGVRASQANSPMSPPPAPKPSGGFNSDDYAAQEAAVFGTAGGGSSSASSSSSSKPKAPPSRLQNEPSSPPNPRLTRDAARKSKAKKSQQQQQQRKAAPAESGSPPPVDSDEALARRLQEEMLEADRRAERQAEMDDMELARRMQEESFVFATAAGNRREGSTGSGSGRSDRAARRSSRTSSRSGSGIGDNGNGGSSASEQRRRTATSPDTGAPSMGVPTAVRNHQGAGGGGRRTQRRASDVNDDAAFARRLQEDHDRLAAMGMNDIGGAGGGGGAPVGGRIAAGDPNGIGSVGSAAHDEDLELARRMQTFEQLGMGRINSGRNAGELPELPPTRQEFLDLRRMQEQEAARRAIEQRLLDEEAAMIANFSSSDDVPFGTGSGGPSSSGSGVGSGAGSSGGGGGGGGGGSSPTVNNSGPPKPPRPTAGPTTATPISSSSGNGNRSHPSNNINMHPDAMLPSGLGRSISSGTQPVDHPGAHRREESRGTASVGGRVHPDASFPVPNVGVPTADPPPSTTKKKRRGFLNTLLGRDKEERDRDRVTREPGDDSSHRSVPNMSDMPSSAPHHHRTNSRSSKGQHHRSPGGGPSSAQAAPSAGGHRSPPAVPAPIPPPPPPAPTARIPGPLPHSVAISSTVPVAAGAELASTQQQQQQANQQKKQHRRVLGGGRVPKPPQQPQGAVPTCSACGQPALSYLATLDKKYHPQCFKCMGCHQVIDPSGPFAYMTDDRGDKHPLHRSCYAELYGVKCAVCMQSIPAGPDGKVSYVKHPFFDSEHMCPSHASNPGRRCTGCHRFEPIGNGFADLQDANRCVCFSCCRTVVVDSEDAKPLWDKVVRFFEETLQLPIWPDMREVPILVVGYEALNDQLQNTAHAGSSQIMTRGLCLSEHQSGRRLALPKMRFDKKNRSFLPNDPESKGYTFFQVPDASKINPDSSVTAILCLSGLPADLTASVLAHEATHAWFKLHPSFDITDPIPLQVEEGCCQLMAQLFLTDGLDPASTETYDDKGPSDEKLRQYFKFSIETDENKIYGEGYRMAATAHASIGIEALLSHVVLYKEFPVVN